MAVIEIQTIEGGRLERVGIYFDTITDRAVRWGDDLLSGVDPKPSLRLLDKDARSGGKVIGAWQQEGYEPEQAS